MTRHRLSPEARGLLSAIRNLDGYPAYPGEVAEASGIEMIEFHGVAQELTRAGLLRIERRKDPKTGLPRPFRWHLLTPEEGS